MQKNKKKMQSIIQDRTILSSTLTSLATEPLDHLLDISTSHHGFCQRQTKKERPSSRKRTASVSDTEEFVTGCISISFLMRHKQPPDWP
jgi:hypothetical protein